MKRKQERGHQRGERGVAALEAAIILPVAVFLIFACVELYQYYRAASLIDRMAFTVANGVAMQRELYDDGNCTEANDICVYQTIASDVFQPLDYAAHGGMIISAYAATEPDGSGNVVWELLPEWTKTYKGTGAPNPATKVNDSSGFPPVRVGGTVVVAEIFYEHEPFVMSSAFWETLGGKRNMYSRFYFRPRFDDMRVLR